MIIYRYRFFNIMLCAAVLAVGFACSDSTGNSDIKPPELPSLENLQMNYSTFDQDTTAQKAGTPQLQSGEYQNFGTAIGYTIGPKILAQVVLAFPRALLSAADGANPELNGDGEWEWSFSGSQNGQTFEVRLLAGVDADANQVTWQMYITADNQEVQVDNFLFFEGTTTTDGKEGTWTYYDLFSEQNGTAVLSLHWLIESENEKQLDIEVLATNNDDIAEGSTFSYASSGAVKTLTVYDAATGETVEIYWNDETLVGYIIAPGYNGGVQACWGSDLKNDTACAEVEA